MRGLTVSVPKTFAARDAGECSVERELAEVVTISAVGNTSLAATAKNTMFEDILLINTTHIINNHVYTFHMALLSI